ncbi:MAG: hypothetical protein ABSF28_26750, partial [Terracidiphilus sp.]
MTSKSCVLRNSSFFCVLLAICLLPAWPKDKQAPDYPLSGKVLSTSAKGAHSYQVETDTRIYLLLCDKVKGLHFSMPECKAGDKPIETGDTIHFRVDDDSAYLAAAKGAEDGLRILTMELKVIPPMPPATGNSTGTERGMVIGAGMHIMGQKKVPWSTDPSSVKARNLGGGFVGGPAMPTGPVMAIPSTGGAPVLVIPTAPMNGGFVTGVPVTGGPPIVGMATGGAAAGGMHGGGAPPWVHLLRVRAGDTIYQLECSAKPCAIDKTPIGLGDTLVVRAEKKWAYVSSNNGGGKEQKLRILSE